MTRLPLSRRGFMVSTSAIAALAATAGPRAAFAQEKVLRLRLDTDNEILDPEGPEGMFEPLAQREGLVARIKRRRLARRH